MSWETITVAVEEFAKVLDGLRRAGATITGCCPSTDGYRVTYCTGTHRLPEPS